MASGSHIESAFTLIYFSLAYLRKPGPQIKNCERSHIFNKAFLFVLFCISLGATCMRLGFLVFAASPLITLFPHMVTSSPSFVVSDMHVTHSVKNSQGALVKLRNSTTTLTVYRDWICFLITLKQTQSCFIWGLTNSRHSFNVD